MHSLECNDVLTEGTKYLLKHATNYYKDLFGSAPRNLFHGSTDFCNQDEKISLSDNEEIAREFTMEEVKTDLFSMKANKVPGPDNIAVEFY